MRYKLINLPNKNFSTIQQILYNRGIAEQDILHYITLEKNTRLIIHLVFFNRFF